MANTARILAPSSPHRRPPRSFWLCFYFASSFCFWDSTRDSIRCQWCTRAEMPSRLPWVTVSPVFFLPVYRFIKRPHLFSVASFLNATAVKTRLEGKTNHNVFVVSRSCSIPFVPAVDAAQGNAEKLETDRCFALRSAESHVGLIWMMFTDSWTEPKLNESRRLEPRRRRRRRRRWRRVKCV